MTIRNGVTTAFALVNKVQKNGQIIYKRVYWDGNGYYVHSNRENGFTEDVNHLEHLFLKESELKDNIYELFGKKVT